MNILEWWNSPSGIIIVNRIIMAAIGVLLIALSALGIDMALNETLIDMGWLYVLMAVYAYSGVIILLSTDKSPRFIIFLAGITYAVMHAIQNLTILQIATVPSAMLGLIMDLVMVISSILCLLEDRHSTLRLLGICLINLATVFTAQMADVLGFTHMFGPTTFLWTIVDCVFLAVFMCLLLRPGVREESLNSRMRKGMTVVDSMLISEPSTFIHDRDVDALVGKDRSEWTVNGSSGSISSEYTTEVYDGRKVTQMVSYTWGKEDTVRISIIPRAKYMPYGSGFALKGYSIEEQDGSRYLRLYGEDGSFFKLLIKDDDIPEQDVPDEQKRDDDPINYVEERAFSG